jgi:type III secretion protein L
MSQEMQSFGNLIKGDGGKVLGGPGAKQKVVKNQIVSARKEAARILEEAEDFAAGIRREARREAENLKSEAYAEGTENALTEFERNLVETREIREKVWRESEKDLLRLAVRLAERIVGREIETRAREAPATPAAPPWRGATSRRSLSIWRTASRGRPGRG